MRSLLELLRLRFVVGLASRSRKGPWTAPVFFAPARDGRTLYFLSDPGSRHCRELARDPRAAGSLWVETLSVRRIRGAQLTGRVRALSGREAGAALAIYLRRFPAAAALLAARRRERVYAFELATAKVTDNRRGFGSKQELAFRR
jgi:uncharacterized protein YhbP (UPF0306 family)